MAVTTTLAMAGATAVLKRLLDDLYTFAKEQAIHRLGKTRADLRESTIAKSLVSVTKVKTLWNVEKEVSLYDFYYPSRVQFLDVDKKIASLKEFGTKSNFVIQGTAGQGKSIFLRFLCGQELNEGSSSNRIPLFVELRRIKKDFGVKSLILQALEKFKLPATSEAWEFFASSGKFVLLLDAFDEIDPAFSELAVSEIEHLIDVHGDNLQILVTSRPDADIQRSTKFRVCKLTPLESEDHLPFLKKVCSDKTQAEEMLKVISQSKADIQGLLTTPLMLTLLVILYKTIQTIPDTVPKFYEELFDVLFYRHDHSKPGFRRKRFTSLDDSSIKRLFAAFCFVVRLQSLGILSNAQMQACVERACQACGLKVEPEAFKNELTKTICLLQQDGFEISFIHKSVAQYYAASFIAASGESFAAKFYRRAASTFGREWELELKFLFEIDSYRWSKFYEIPLLDRVATQIGYNFGDPTAHAENAIRERVAPFISLRITEDSKKLSFRGWSRVVNSDPVLEVVGTDWAAELYRRTRTSADFEQLLIDVIHPQHKNTDGYTVPMDAVLGVLSKTVPDLEKIVLNKLKIRRARAQQIIDLENEKVDLLKDFEI